MTTATVAMPALHTVVAFGDALAHDPGLGKRYDADLCRQYEGDR